MTAVRRQPTVPPWADPSSEIGQTCLLSSFNGPPLRKICYNHFLFAFSIKYRKA